MLARDPDASPSREIHAQLKDREIDQNIEEVTRSTLDISATLPAALGRYSGVLSCRVSFGEGGECEFRGCWGGVWSLQLNIVAGPCVAGIFDLVPWGPFF